MIPNRYVIFWNNQPIGLDNKLMFKTENPNDIFYWKTKSEAEDYVSNIIVRYPTLIVKEIQFRIMDSK